MEFKPESKAESVIRNAVIALLRVLLLCAFPHLSAWLNRSTSRAPVIERAWLDESSTRVYIEMALREHQGDLINTNGIFICTASQASPDASHCSGEGDRVEPTHVHKDPFVWHVIWSETKRGSFKDVNPDAELVIPTIGLLKSSALPDEVLEAIRKEDTYLVLAVDEKLFDSIYITKP